MTGHDLYPPSPEARAFIETAEILAEPYNEIIADLRAKLAAAEQERDDIFGEALRYKRLRIEEKSRAERAEAVLAAVREVRDELARDVPAVERPEALAVAAHSRSIADRLTAALAAAEQDEPKTMSYYGTGLLARIGKQNARSRD